MGRTVAILSGVRTPIGAFGGGLSSLSPCELATRVAREAIDRSGLTADQIGQAVFGNVIHTAPEDMYLARVAVIRAGGPETTPALTLNRLCGSGLQAAISGAEQILLGHTDFALVGGAENMSRAGHLMSAARWGTKMGDIYATDMMLGALTDPFGNGHMGVTAENVATHACVDRKTQDAFALESHRRAAVAIREGRFRDQILPIHLQGRRSDTVIDTDEHVRMDAKAEDFSKLTPVFIKEGSVTAGNASGLNDGAAALVLGEEQTARAAGLRPLARIRSYGLGGVAPKLMGMGPVPAVVQALSRAGLVQEDLDVIESNEAFAAQACAVSAALGLPAEKVNPNGGAIALGHPIGATGAILLVKLAYELIRTEGRYGLVTMCIGGGQGIAVIIERV